MGDNAVGDNAVPPPGVDTTKPSIARVYDYLLGGKDNFAVDREVGEMSLRIMPDGREGPRSNRAFLRRAVRYLAADAGIRQFLDLGSGLPSQGNVHEVAQAVDKKARVVYVDYDPVVLAHARALLAGDYSDVVLGDLRGPETILNHPAVNAMLDFDQPVALLLLSVLHHIGDDADPAGIVAAYRDAVAPGSHLAISHLHKPSPDLLEDRELAELSEEVFRKAFGTSRWRGEEEIRSFFGDWDMVPPGLVPVVDWRPEPGDPGKRYLTYRLVLGGVARKP
ncbi:MAG TPA: SAM-dependent methyltransferase [Streptosporangiaceae bacterium]